jgi:hypothetical protein
VGVRVGTMRGDHAAVRQELTGVVEDQHAVAEEVPTLLGVTSDGDGCVAVSRVR